MLHNHAMISSRSLGGTREKSSFDRLRMISRYAGSGRFLAMHDYPISTRFVHKGARPCGSDAKSLWIGPVFSPVTCASGATGPAFGGCCPAVPVNHRRCPVMSNYQILLFSGFSVVG